MKKPALLFSAFLMFALFFPSMAHARNGAICDGRYHWVNVQGTKSLDGTLTGFQYICQAGSSQGPLVIFLDGGGGCWDGDTCDCQPDAFGLCHGPNSTIFRNHFDGVDSYDGQSWGSEFSPAFIPPLGQTAAFSGPTSPFNRNWNFVFIPYSTGDAFMGQRVRKYTTSDGRTISASHMGYKDLGLDLQVITSLFPQPSKVAVWGDSAGGVGADCNLSRFATNWPQTMWELSNGGPAYGTADIMPLIPTVAQTWGVWEPGPGGAIVEKTCPIIAQAGSTDWNLEWVVRYNANNLPSVRKALTDDYSDQTVSGFACLLGATPDSTGSCAGAVASTLADEFTDVINGNPNYKVYYHTGVCHSEREQDGNTVAGGSDPSCDFDVTSTSGMVQAGIAFRDWVNAWINNGPGWVNVQ